MRPDVNGLEPLLAKLVFLNRRSLQLQLGQVYLSIPPIRVSNGFQANLPASLATFKPELVDDSADNEDEMICGDASWVRGVSMGRGKGSNISLALPK